MLAHFPISEMEEKRKNEPPPKVGPISKQIAAKAKLRSGMIRNSGCFRKITSIKVIWFIFLEYNPLMGSGTSSSSGANSINSRYGGRRGGGWG